MEPLDDLYRCMIRNPVTGEYTLLPNIVACYSIASGFFYCPETNQFKVLCMFMPVKPVSDVSSASSMDLDLSSDSDSGSDSDMNLDLDSNHDTSSEGSDSDTGSEDQAPYSDSDSDFVCIESNAIGEIYVKGHDSWESLDSLPFRPDNIYSPCHLEKTIHWLCSDKAVSNLIVFFNFETHEFGEISGPALVRKGHGYRYSIKLALVVIGNRLAIIDGFTKRSKVSVWVMKEYGVKDSWSREYLIDDLAWAFVSVLRNSTLTCRNNGEIVIVSGLGFILFYDLNKKKGRVVNHPPLDHEWKPLMHTPSFISLEDVMSGSKLEVVKVAPRLADPVLIPDNYLELATSF
ncbi:uncharacterized protein LOC143537591 [Bidens hawaiensis]|uniref:uncharacterized protein LOC143537591 n=1 Tax=Bidens hawaiensis TaxID=980011 RepID=UPI004049D913